MLKGCRATEDIAPNEGLCFIPDKVLMTRLKALKSPIAEMLMNHDSIFVACQEREFNCLLAYVIYERIQGAQSFYHPYFEANPVDVSPCMWN